MSENNKTICCGENNEGISKNEPNEDISCCGGTDIEQVEELEESMGCGCGGEFPDESQVTNPDKPKLNAAGEFFEEFEELARSMGIVDIGYTQVVPEIINEEEPLYSNAIVLILKMGNDIIKTAPGKIAQQLNDATYAKLGNITYALSDFIRSNGFATQIAHPYGSMVGFSLLGQKAGLGWIGKSGLLITPELGPRLKISAIFTSIENLPVKEGVDHSWISDYCEKCNKCRIACPENAMIEKIHPDGKNEIEFKSELCMGCSRGCTYCIEECIFDKRDYSQVKNIFDKLKAKLAAKKSIK